MVMARLNQNLSHTLSLRKIWATNQSVGIQNTLSVQIGNCVVGTQQERRYEGMMINNFLNNEEIKSN